MEDDISVVDVWIGRTIIRSSHQMTYAQAQAILDGKELLPDQQLQGGKEEVARVRQDLLILSAVGERFKCRREAEGALELSSAELRFELDDNNTPVRVFTKQELHMNWIVAEMMISANSCVAEKIYRTFPSCALLRRHAPPSSDAFSRLLEGSFGRTEGSVTKLSDGLTWRAWDSITMLPHNVLNGRFSTTDIIADSLADIIRTHLPTSRTSLQDEATPIYVEMGNEEVDMANEEEEDLGLGDKLSPGGEDEEPHPVTESSAAEYSMGATASKEDSRDSDSESSKAQAAVD
ncbi:hypothetical protein CBR_g18657 [Chara braunii]|uniref:DIS3-like exonuclease 1 n=1 Tax=Chara braunii TaxID=69332 RepID=A0A388JTE7_CHABU|nr:hypothetical protein CBR_g18657 [Chara braunii]|eukprot:GBG61065.1 hypothetical protein CBR_g18657 [Chara braunii]